VRNSLTDVLCWIRGWRYDLDGWLVRALRDSDPCLSERPDLGFTEEACIAVRSAEIARMVDRGEVTGE
jgi:hypothetical protein